LAPDRYFISGFSPIEIGLRVQQIFERTPFTKLSDDVTVVNCIVDLLKGKNVWMIQLSQNIDLILEQGSTMRFQVANMDNLNCPGIVLIILFEALKNSAAEAAANYVIQVVTILPDSLLRALTLCYLILLSFLITTDLCISLQVGELFCQYCF